MDYLQLIKDKESELSQMFSRMDQDARIFDLTPYVMKGVGVNGADPKKINKAYHVTLPDAKQFLEDVTAKLFGIRRQVVVEGDKMAKDKTSVIERFLDDIEFESDALLSRKGQSPVFVRNAYLVNKRGPIVNQILLSYEKGVFRADIRPLDARYFTYEMGPDGMLWGCITTKRSKADIEREYGIIVKSSTGELRDFWNDEVNVILIDGKQAKENENKYGKPPFCICFPLTASSMDANFLTDLGDSILHTLRMADGSSLFDEKNYIASYLKTMSSDALFPGTQLPGDDDGILQDKPEGAPPGSGQTAQVKKPAILWPYRELPASASMYIGLINDSIQRGTYAAIRQGIIDLPQSGVAIAQKVALQNVGLLPRLNCLASLAQATTETVIEQFQIIGDTIELGAPGHTRKYSPSDLDGDYTIKYRFYTQSQEQMAGATSIARAVEPWISSETIQEEILLLEDGTGERSKIAMEQAAKANPVIDLRNKMISFVHARDKTTDKELKQIYNAAALDLHEQIISIYKQRYASETNPAPVNIAQDARVEQNGAPGIPLFGGGQQAVSR